LKKVDTYIANIYVGLRIGYTNDTYDFSYLESVVQDNVNEVKLCVTVTKTKFLYTDGYDDGAIIGLINYPRFPSTKEELKAKALELSKILLDKLKQQRVSVVFSDETIMLSKEDI
jgi:hypothetical protein